GFDQSGVAVTELVSALSGALGLGSHSLTAAQCRALSRKRVTEGDSARAGQRIDHSARIGGSPMLRAATPGSAWAAWKANEAGMSPTSRAPSRCASDAWTDGLGKALTWGW